MFECCMMMSVVPLCKYMRWRVEELELARSNRST